MKKIKWQDVKTQHDGDCWAIAISKATNQTYKDVYKLMTPFLDEEGGLDREVTYVYLERFGYARNNVNGYTVKELLQLYDTQNNKILVGIKDHIFYIENDTIYDNKDIEYRGYTYDSEVEVVYHKAK